MTEPPRKKMKYEKEINFYLFDNGYLSEDGTTIIKENITSNMQINPNMQIKPIMQIQQVEGGDIYIIGNMKNNDTILDKYYTLDEIFIKLKNGDFSIGIMNHYCSNMYKNIITNINDYNHDDNNEIRLHYTKAKSYPENNAWRTIKWDLFAQYIRQ